MRTKVAVENDHVRAEMRGRQTAEETAQFLREAAGAALKHERTRILIVVRESRAIFKVEDYRISDYFRAMAERPGYRVALLTDTSEIYAEHSYIEALARHRGLKVRAFREQEPALSWLRLDD